MTNTEPLNLKTGKSTGELIAAVDALREMIPELTIPQACRRVGLPKETYYWNRRKALAVIDQAQGEAA